MQITNQNITIISRQSRLALQQAEIVKNQLRQIYPKLIINIIGISTSGDEILDQPLNKIGGKGLFVTELENYLLEGKADIAVHSLKDMPATLAPGLTLGAILERADARDVFVSAKYKTLNDLPQNSIVGTSSLRRQAQILALRSDLIIESLRGNVETRLQKLVAGKYAAIILAAAGLERLGLKQWLNAPLEISAMLPAVGQGALGIEYKIDRSDIQAMLKPLNHAGTAICVTAERAMNAKLDGGCQAPIAGFATLENNLLKMQGLVADPNGKKIFSAVVTGDPREAEAIGCQVAVQLLEQGAGDIIENLKGLWQKDAW